MKTFFLACNCGKDGTKKDTYCNPETGKCDCHDNYRGLTCEECAIGHYDYPTCKRMCFLAFCSLLIIIQIQDL